MAKQLVKEHEESGAEVPTMQQITQLVLRARSVPPAEKRHTMMLLFRHWGYAGGEKEKPPPTAPPPPPPGPVLPRKPWTSGYNRSENIKVGRPDMKEAWAEGENPYQRYGIPNEPAPTPKPQPDAIVMPTVRTSTQLMDTDASAFFLRSQALSVPHTPLPKPPRRFCY